MNEFETFVVTYKKWYKNDGYKDKTSIFRGETALNRFLLEELELSYRWPIIVTGIWRI